MTTYQPQQNDDLRRAVVNAIHEHWVLFLVEGIVLLVLGAAAIIVPVIATLAFTLLIGWLFLISGVVGLITTFWMRNVPGFWWALISGVVGIAAGIVLLLWPISGTVSLTLLLIAFFLVEGIVTLMYAFEHRGRLSGRWGWMLASGIVDLILAGIIFAGLPESATWAWACWLASICCSAGARWSPWRSPLEAVPAQRKASPARSAAIRSSFRGRGSAKLLTKDEARRIAANIAKLPELVRKE